MRLRTFALPVVLTSLAACDTGPTTPSTVPAPPPPVTTTVSEGSRSGLSERLLMRIPFQTSRIGTIRASVDWTFPDTTIYVYISSGTCEIEQINAGECRFIAASLTTAPKPRVLTVTAAQPGDYTLYIGNFAGAEESVSWQVSLTSSAAATAVGSAAAARPAAPPPAGWIH
jgi:hypothetical protein